MSNVVKISGISGANNVSGGGIGKGRTLYPGYLFNATANDRGKAEKRPGYETTITLAGAHSLFAGINGILVADATNIYSVDIDKESTSSLAAHGCPDTTPFYYVEIGDCIYISNKYYCGCFESDAIRTWGQIITDMDTMNWVKETNGSRYFLADAGTGLASAVMKPHDHVHIPVAMSFICEGHGRIWGARSTDVFFSDAGSPEWWQDDINNFRFKDDVRMIAPSQGGMFIGFDDHTVFLGGNDPESMTAKTINYGAVENTLQFITGFNEIQPSTPLWLSPQGQPIAGMPDGSVMDISGGRLRTDTEAGIGSYFREIDGRPQYFATVRVPDTVINGDQATLDFLEG